MGQRIFVFIVGGATRSEVLFADFILSIRRYGFQKEQILYFSVQTYIWFSW